MSPADANVAAAGTVARSAPARKNRARASRRSGATARSTVATSVIETVMAHHGRVPENRRMSGAKPPSSLWSRSGMFVIASRTNARGSLPGST
jgi:hypothetical protein